MPRGFSDVVDWSALLIDLWRHLDGSCPSWVNRITSIAFMIHQCREAAAVSLLVVQFSNRATSLIDRSLKLVRLSAASVPASYR
jgi:hypothetical protein